MKWLVTGGAGYIGSVVAQLLVEAGDDVVILDDLSTGDETVIPPAARFIQGRVHDRIDDVLDPSFDGVLHFAASISAGESVSLPEKYWTNNLIGSLRLLDALRRHGVRRLIFSSTANVYGDPDSVPIPEDAPTRPPNPYAASKLAVDFALRDEAVAHDLAAISLRYFNVVGAHRVGSTNGASGNLSGRLIGERHDPETHLVPLALAVAAGKRDKLQLFGEDYPTPDGTCVRDYIHVSDLAAAHLAAISALTPGTHRVYNLGNGRGFSNREVIEVVRDITGADVPVEIGPRRAGDPAVLVAGSQRAQSELGWVPQHSDLAEMVSDAWEFYQSVYGQ